MQYLRPEPERTWAASLQILTGCSLFALAYLPFNFLMTALHHGVLKMLGGGNRGFSATYKVICYAHAAGILNVVWFCGGGILVIPFYFVSSIVGLRKVHGVESWKAVASVIVPFALLSISRDQRRCALDP